MRQSDEILVLVDPQKKLDIESSASYLDDSRILANKTLVLLHPKGKDHPKGTHEFIEKTKCQYHYHIREARKEDLQRLGRHLLDQQIGLVLAGGGARGMAHLGVWRAIKELEIPVDCIGGTSMGAFLGGVMAQDIDTKELHEIVKGIAYSKPSRDINPVPYLSIIRGKNLNKVLKQHYLSYEIEDCIIPFYCISTDLTEVAPFVHHRGNMFKAIRASGSLPGIVPPVPIEGHWHVDGGIIDNFPVREMIRKTIKTIIGVSFNLGDNPSTQHMEIPNMKKQILHGLFKTKDEYNLPSIIEMVMLSTTANSQSRQNQAEKMVDVLIRPDVSEFGLLEWTAFEKVVESGYNAAMEALSSFKHN